MGQNASQTDRSGTLVNSRSNSTSCRPNSHLFGVVLAEQHHEWQVARHYLFQEALSESLLTVITEPEQEASQLQTVTA